MHTNRLPSYMSNYWYATRVDHYDARINRLFRRSPVCPKLAWVERSRPVNRLRDGRRSHAREPFNNGRQLAACLVLMRQRHSNGGKPQLLVISNRGCLSAHAIDSWRCILSFRGPITATMRAAAGAVTLKPVAEPTGPVAGEMLIIP